MRRRVIAAGAAVLSAASLALVPSATAAPPGGIDTKPPTIHIEVDPSPGTGAWSGWYADSVTVHLYATDTFEFVTVDYTLSGAQTGSGRTDEHGTALTIRNQGVTTLDVTATDFFGNVATRTYGIGVDLTDPTVSFSGAATDGQPVRRGDTRALTFACADVPTAVQACYGRIGDEPFRSGSPVPTGVNGPVAVTVTAIDAVGRWVERQFTYTVVDPVLAVTGNPSIVGNPTEAQVGQTLVAAGGTFAPAATRVDYHWRVEGRPEVVAPTYQVGPEDVGRRITLYATGHRAEHAVATTPTVGNVLVAAGRLQVTGHPSVVGTPREGVTLTVVRPDEVSPTPQFVRTLWTLGGTVVETDAARLALTSAHVGKRLSCVQVFGRPGYADLRVPCRFAGGATAVSVSGNAWKVRTPARVVGTPKAGSRLRAVAPRLSGKAGRHTYQWLRNGAVIKGARASSYRLRAADRGRRITVRVTATTPYRPATVSVARALRVRR